LPGGIAVDASREDSEKHQQEIISIEREHQEKVLLLGQLPIAENCETGETGLAQHLHIQNQEPEKMKILRKELADKTEELDKLKCQLTSKEEKLNQTLTISDKQKS
jgi:hypothetical protein